METRKTVSYPRVLQTALMIIILKGVFSAALLLG